MSETTEAPANALDAIRSFPERDAPAPQQTTETPQEPAAEQSPAEPAPKPEAPKKEPWEVTRVRQLTARNAAMLAEIEELKKHLPKPDPAAPAPHQDEAARVERAAAEMIRQREFNAECDKVFTQGKTDFPDFPDALNRLWEVTGRGTPAQAALIEAALEAGDAHKVIHALSTDLEEADRISQLPPARMGAALAKLAAKATAEPAAPKPPPVSRAPAPIKPLAQGGGNAEPRLDTNSQEEFERAFAKEKAKRGR